MEAEESALKTKEEIEAEVTKAMLSRIEDFKQQADNLTLEGVRRTLEKDLGMEKLSLDSHKKFIKQCLEKYFYGADAKNASETEGKTAEDLQSVKEDQPPEDLINSNSDVNDNLDGSPALIGDEQPDRETEKSHNGTEHDSQINEDLIKKAIRKRAPYFRSNLEITLAKVRRLLEEDLKLEKNSLDAFKKFISIELDAILQSGEAVETTNGAKKDSKKSTKKEVTRKASKGTKKTRKDSDASDSNDVLGEEDDEDDEEIKKPKKRPAKKLKEDAKGSKKQKLSAQRSKASGAGKKKTMKEDSEKSDEGDGEGSSGGDRSQSSGEEEEIKKKNEKLAQIYGKQVEHLKSIIKSCGIGIPPSVYKRVKQAPESKREAHLIKELKEILEKEGLSSDPSEKEIKAVKKRKERAKELEGIDMSNIVTSSRRRSTSSFIPPPKPKLDIESDADEEGEEEDGENNEEDSDEGDNDGEDSSEGSDEDDAEEESD